MKLIGATRYHFQVDLMHAGCLGVLSYFLGSVLTELVASADQKGRSAKLENLWARIQHWYAELDINCRFTQLPLAAFERTDKGFPLLKGKAAETQGLLYVLLQVCVEVDDGSSHHRHRIRALT